ncbi:MAG: two-component system chemotaxis response regulator CheB [Myxococcota bacterium]|jgi:two-component system chemotaxis response regulator CheB
MTLSISVPGREIINLVAALLETPVHRASNAVHGAITYGASAQVGRIVVSIGIDAGLAKVLGTMFFGDNPVGDTATFSALELANMVAGLVAPNVPGNHPVTPPRVLADVYKELECTSTRWFGSEGGVLAVRVWERQQDTISAKPWILVVHSDPLIRLSLANALRSREDMELATTAGTLERGLSDADLATPDLLLVDGDLMTPALSENAKNRYRVLTIRGSFHPSRFGTLPRLTGIINRAAANEWINAHLQRAICALRNHPCPEQAHDLHPKQRTPPRCELKAAIRVHVLKAKPTPHVLPRRPLRKTTRLIAIASSTGGPDALAILLPQLPADLPVPVLLVQHMHPSFMEQFAERLDRLCSLQVKIAFNGAIARAGECWLAPGDRHMTASQSNGEVVLSISKAPHEHGCRPAADPLFRSLTNAFPGQVVATVLTGMGADGAQGGTELGKTGCYVCAQDETTSIVWGMPRALVRLGGAQSQLPLRDIASKLVAELIMPDKERCSTP